MNCARTACQTPLEPTDVSVKIWNDVGGGFRTYCLFCARRILSPNHQLDEIKLRFEAVPIDENDKAQIESWLVRGPTR